MPKRRRKKDKFSFTVCGEFFPQVYPAFQPQEWSRGGEDPLVTEMRLFCVCQRWAFNRLLEGVSRYEIKKVGQELFGLNSRHTDDARLRAQAVLDSQKDLLGLETEETEKKLGSARHQAINSCNRPSTFKIFGLSHIVQGYPPDKPTSVRSPMFRVPPSASFRPHRCQ